MGTRWPSSRPWPAGKTAVAELKDRPESSFPLARRYADKMIAHAREEAPNECCGILAGPANEGRVEKLYHGINAEKSPVRYNIDPQQLLSIHEETEEARRADAQIAAVRDDFRRHMDADLSVGKAVDAIQARLKALRRSPGRLPSVLARRLRRELLGIDEVLGFLL